MYKISNIEHNPNIKVVRELGNVKVLEYQSDLSVSPEAAATVYFAQKMNIKRRQVMLELTGNSYILQSGAMQWTAGKISSGSGIRGVGDLVGKFISSKVTTESAIKPEYTGHGTIMLEPTYKYVLLVDVGEWGSMVIEDGMFLACESTLNMKTVMRKSLSASIKGGEGLFNLALEGKGVLVLESPVPQEELIEVTLDNDELKIDGSMAVAWSRSLEFTVGRSAKNLIGSAINGEGLVNIYRGTGKVWLAPTR